MSRLLASSAAIALLSTVAFAADLPVPMEPMEEVVVAPGYSWTGVYVGGHGGWGWGDVDADFANGTSFDDEPDGWFAGGQVGVNMQWNWFVAGVEGDASWSDIDGSTACPNAAFSCTTDVEWLASLRARVGAAFDRFLIYGTGGAGFAGVEYDAILNATGVSFGGGDDVTHVGWTAGGGIEIALTDHFTIKGEYLYYDLGDEPLTATSFGNPGTADLTIHTAKIGANFKFGGLGAP
ncbi:MAG: outer membrane protein [Propylenella sp.]